MNSSLTLLRLLEEVVEEIGRLDALASVAPPAAALALQVAAVARIASPDAEAMRTARAALVSARVELLHAAALDPRLLAWEDRAADGERRARSGAALPVPADLPPDAEAAVREAIRPGSTPRPLLLRAMQVIAWVPDDAAADLLASLVLVAGGLTDRLRLPAFSSLRGALRAAAAAEWRAGDVEPMARAALPTLAAEARHLRLQLRLLIDAQAEEDAHLASLGRAAVTGRRALAHLRASVATSVPALATQLALSRPAAGAALERLVELGLAEEVTGRRRDRVFVYAAAWGLA